MVCAGLLKGYERMFERRLFVERIGRVKLVNDQKISEECMQIMMKTQCARLSIWLAEHDRAIRSSGIMKLCLIVGNKLSYIVEDLLRMHR